MTRICIFAGTTIGGYAFWFLGDALGLGFFGEFLLSGAGSVLGVWIGWKIARRFE